MSTCDLYGCVLFGKSNDLAIALWANSTCIQKEYKTVQVTRDNWKVSLRVDNWDESSSCLLLLHQ